MSTPEYTSSRIIELRSENFKRLKAVTIRPDGNMVRIVGKNGAGKSSVLDSIASALGGGDCNPTDPIRHGAKKAKVVLELEDLTVTRTFTKSGSTLVVEGKDGTTKKSPQDLLNSLTGKVTFDPLLFLALKPKDKLDALRKLVGIDTTAIDAARLKAFNERTMVGRELDQQKALVARLPVHADAPEAEVGSTEVLAEIDKANAHNKTVDAALDAAEAGREALVASHARLAVSKTEAEQLERLVALSKGNETAKAGALEAALKAGPKAKIDLAPLEAKLAAIMEEIKSANANNQAFDQAAATVREKTADATRAREATEDAEMKASQAKEQVTAHTAEVANAQKAADEATAKAVALVPVDMSPLRVKLAGLESANAKVRANKQRTDADTALKTKQTQYDAFTRKIEECDEKKQSLLESTKFPVDGLALGEDGVTFKGVSLEQASDAEKLRVSVAIAAAMNPKIKIMLARNASLLDEDSLKLLAELAEKYGLQIWLEVVSSTDKTGVVIEDGHIAGEEVAEEPAEPVAQTATESPKSQSQPQLELPPS